MVRFVPFSLLLIRVGNLITYTEYKILEWFYSYETMSRILLANNYTQNFDLKLNIVGLKNKKHE